MRKDGGITFVEPGTPVYEGMIIGENTRQDDIELTLPKKRNKPICALPPPTSHSEINSCVKMSLEECIDFLEDDELLEVTPLSLRLRKKFLTNLERVRNKRS